MAKKEIALWCVLADFVALSAYAVYTEGYFGFLDAGLEFAAASTWGPQIIADLLVALSVALGWVVADARKRELAYWPFVVLTLTAGSIGPLAYLVHRERVTSRVADRRGAQPGLQHA